MGKKLRSPKQGKNENQECHQITGRHSVRWITSGPKINQYKYEKHAYNYYSIW